QEFETGNIFDLLKLKMGLQEVGELPVESVEVDGWLSEFMLNFQEHSQYKLKNPSKEFHGALRAYQQRGYSWLDFLKSHGIGACLADDMGLGKTVQTIALM